MTEKINLCWAFNWSGSKSQFYFYIGKYLINVTQLIVSILERIDIIMMRPACAS